MAQIYAFSLFENKYLTKFFQKNKKSDAQAGVFVRKPVFLNFLPPGVWAIC